MARAKALRAAMKRAVRDLRQLARDVRPAEPEEVGPTPETARRLRKPTLARLHDEGRISAEQYAAGQEIAEIHYALTAALTAKGAAWDCAGGRGSYADRAMGIMARRPALEAAYRKRYLPWANGSGARRIRIGIDGGEVPWGCSRWEIIALVAVDDVSVEEMTRRIGMRWGRALQALQEALWDYALHAGWVGRAGQANRGLDMRKGEMASIAHG